MEAASSTHSTGTDTITVVCSACSFTIYSVTSFVAFGTSSTAAVATNSGSDTRTMSVLSGSLILGAIGIESSSVSCGSVTLTSSQTLQQSFPCQTVSGQGSISGDSTSQATANAGTFTDSITWTCAACTNGGMGRFIQELQGSNAGSTVTVTQCFGNCGNPAVTIAGTNSTHLINFNTSLTLFYQFQPGLNGFFVNASTTVAKTYNNGQTIYLGIYLVASCPAGQTLFTASCPGSLIASGAFVNPSKGKITLNVPTSTTGLTPGQTAAVAVSCLFAPCDLNDTNTPVTIFQASGVMPAVVTQASVFSTCTCKTGVWAYVTGNIITNVPTVTPTNTVCAGLLDCILPNAVFGLCANPTPACTSVSALIYAGGLAVAATFFTLKVGSEALPTSKLPFGEIFLFWVLAMIFVMSGLTLLFVWVPLFFFFVISLLFRGKAGSFL